MQRNHTFSAVYSTWNGRKVFLSSPRHSSSGSLNNNGVRRECTSGFQENVNGRQFNWFAANGDWLDGRKITSPTTAGYQNTNLRRRGYRVLVSKNPKDDGYIQNRQKSDSWGSTLHIVTHTNADGWGCNANSAKRLEAMYNSPRDRRLARAIFNRLKGPAPGTGEDAQLNPRSDLAELFTDRPRGDAYVELAYHTQEFSNRWVKKRSRKKAAWIYGQAVDVHLDYP